MKFHRSVLIALLFCAAFLFSPSVKATDDLAKRDVADRPNILFIFLDDFGWKDTTYMGSDYYETPHIDRLAKNGLVFTHAYSCAANCAPARASLLSGQYTPRHQIFNVGTEPRGKSEFRRLEHIPGTKTLDPNIRTWAHQLQSAGYKTATMGKWHLSDDPLPYGFDVNIGGTHSGGPPKGYYPPHGNAPNLQDAPANEFLTNRISAEAIKFIRENKNNSWMLYLTHFAVHTPIQANKDLIDKYKNKQPGQLHNNAAMATMIQSVDDGVGKIVATLDELNLTDNTVIMFYSDNGGYGPATDMDPLKGYKGTYYEGGIRVPFFVNWPGKIKPGTSAEPIIGVDMYPTLCEIADAALPSDQPLDGVSLVSLFKGEIKNLNVDSEPRPLYWHFPAYLQSYQQVVDEQRDVLFRSRPCGIVRIGPWKLHQYFESGDVELYNLDSDLGEANNVADQNQDRVDSMLASIQGWRQSINAPVPLKPNPEFDSGKEALAIKAIKKRFEKKKRSKSKSKTK